MKDKIIVGWFKIYGRTHWYEKKSFDKTRYAKGDREGILLSYNYKFIKLKHNVETRVHRVIN